MKNKTSLTLLEQTVMVLVFALAAALCLRAFVWADQSSRRASSRDRALLCAQSAAETLKCQKGDLAAAAERLGGTADDAGWNIYYNEEFAVSDLPAAWRLRVTPVHTGVSGLGSARVEVTPEAGGEPLAALWVSWQEVMDGGA